MICPVDNVVEPGLVRTKGSKTVVAAGSDSITAALPRAKVETPEVIGEPALKFVSRKINQGKYGTGGAPCDIETRRAVKRSAATSSSLILIPQAAKRSAGMLLASTPAMVGLRLFWTSISA